MAAGDDRPDELPTPDRLRAAVESLSHEELHQVLQHFRDGLLDSDVGPTALPRSEVRRPRREQVATYRLRVDLRDTRPPVWRRLEVASDMFLDELHRVLQAAFGWTDSHLHRFSVGDPYDRDSAVFLCPWEVDAGDDDGVDARTVRLDELLVEPGDRLRYLYDFGDDWDHAVRLEHVGPRPATTVRACCTGGRRAGPPEDCGGPWGYEELVQAGEVDGAAFSIEEANRAIESIGVPVADGWPLVAPRMTADLLADRLGWLLERAEDGGLPLTSAGYLTPAVVRAAFEAWDLDAEWIGTGNRELHTIPVLEVRELAQELRLLRRYKGRLLLTKLGQAVRRDRAGLLELLRSSG